MKIILPYVTREQLYKEHTTTSLLKTLKFNIKSSPIKCETFQNIFAQTGKIDGEPIIPVTMLSLNSL